MSVLELNGRVFDASTTGTLTLTGEGSATTDVTQGLAKSWTRHNAASVSDSFNIASITDAGTGDYNPNFTNNMSSANYTMTCSGLHDSGSHIVWGCFDNDAGVSETDEYHVNYCKNANGALLDNAFAAEAIFGDLA